MVNVTSAYVAQLPWQGKQSQVFHQQHSLVSRILHTTLFNVTVGVNTKAGFKTFFFLPLFNQKHEWNKPDFARHNINRQVALDVILLGKKKTKQNGKN